MAPRKPAEPRLESLIPLIYEAATDEHRWQAVLDAITTGFGAPAGGLNVHDVRSGTGTLDLVSGLSPDWARAYDEHFAAVNVWANRGAAFLIPGRIFNADEIVAKSELLRTEYYNDFLEPHGVDGLMGVILAVDDLRFAALNITRRNGSNWTPGQVRCFNRLAPHLQRAFQIRQRIASVEMQRAAALDALDRLTTGLILLDERGPFFVNAEAQRILDQRDGLSLEGKRLRGARVPVTNALAALIQGALETGAGRGAASGGTLSLPRPSMKRPLTALVVPLPRSARRPLLHSAAAVLFLADPEAQLETPLDGLRRLYALTPAEGRLAGLLIQGMSLERAAEVMEIAVGTARTHLKHVFGKTETTRQGELVHLLLRSTPPVRESSPERSGRARRDR